MDPRLGVHRRGFDDFASYRNFLQLGGDDQSNGRPQEGKCNETPLSMVFYFPLFSVLLLLCPGGVRRPGRHDSEMKYHRGFSSSKFAELQG